MPEDFDLFAQDVLSNEEWFRTLCIKLFTNGDGKKFIEFFNQLIIHRSLMCGGVDPHNVSYREGFFHLIREINLSINKFNHDNRSVKK
tara:strand:+ start:3410 stop:3673 length:264 start_codon:yes stop_codon:yes gene_type:complete